MSQKSNLQKSGKRPSRSPEPTGDSSDSGRSRSLSARRTSSRKLDGSQRQTAAQSKWKIEDYNSTSEDEDKGNLAGSASQDVRFRRSERLKAVVKGETSSLSKDYK